MKETFPNKLIIFLFLLKHLYNINNKIQMKLYFHLLVILVIIEGILPLNIRKKSIKSLDNGPIQKNSQFSYESSPEEIYPFNIYPNYRFSQTKLNERENLNVYNQIQSESSETSQAGDDKPIFTLNIHAPQETTDDIIGFSNKNTFSQ